MYLLIPSSTHSGAQLVTIFFTPIQVHNLSPFFHTDSGAQLVTIFSHPFRCTTCHHFFFFFQSLAYFFHFYLSFSSSQTATVFVVFIYHIEVQSRSKIILTCSCSQVGVAYMLQVGEKNCYELTHRSDKISHQFLSWSTFAQYCTWLLGKGSPI